MAMQDPTTATASADVVGVFGDNFQQVFAGARPLKATVKELSKVMEHPVENGAVISDHKVVQPVEIEFALVLMAEHYRDAYQQIRQHFIASTLLSVQTRTAVYGRMVIAEMPHEEDPSLYNAITI